MYKEKDVALPTPHPIIGKCLAGRVFLVIVIILNNKKSVKMGFRDFTNHSPFPTTIIPHKAIVRKQG